MERCVCRVVSPWQQYMSKGDVFQTVLIQMRRMRPSDEKSAEENASRGKFKVC